MKRSIKLFNVLMCLLFVSLIFVSAYFLTIKFLVK